MKKLFRTSFAAALTVLLILPAFKNVPNDYWAAADPIYGWQALSPDTFWQAFNAKDITTDFSDAESVTEEFKEAVDVTNGMGIGQADHPLPVSV